MGGSAWVVRAATTGYRQEIEAFLAWMGRKHSKQALQHLNPTSYALAKLPKAVKYKKGGFKTLGAPATAKKSVREDVV